MSAKSAIYLLIKLDNLIYSFIHVFPMSLTVTILQSLFCIFSPPPLFLGSPERRVHPGDRTVPAAAQTVCRGGCRAVLQLVHHGAGGPGLRATVLAPSTDHGGSHSSSHSLLSLVGTSWFGKILLSSLLYN